jgi:DNA-binding NtrC family response regulator
LAGTSCTTRELHEATRALGATKLHVVIRGERGIGKRVWAETLHRESGARQDSFLALEVAGLDESRAVRALFGATGAADRARRDRVTLYVGGIDVVALGAQRRLAEWMATDDHEHVRVVLGSATMLEQRLRAGAFCAQLYRRVALAQLSVPPLRERREDIPAIAECYLDCAAYDRRTVPARLAPSARAVLAEHCWPENISELAGVLERASARAGRTIRREHVEAVLGARIRRSAGAGVEPLATIEREHLLAALAACGGNLSLAARHLGIGRNTLARKLRDGAGAAEKTRIHATG